MFRLTLLLANRQKSEYLAKIFCSVLTMAPENFASDYRIRYDGLANHGNLTKMSSYPEYISKVESIAVIGQFAYFSTS